MDRVGDLAEHRVRLAAARRAVGQNSDAVAVSRRLAQRGDLGKDVGLRGRGAQHAVEGEGVEIFDCVCAGKEAEEVEEEVGEEASGA